eukprot:CAMPEP_0185029066 /NCGR_PEP_ID=MMETSP1103-20130426/15150_1 /TAXON_ID=36769 /ORGANISM="Paraphysomonas bandaiensis, Strain Caron Lab Isolate" /LENGTH=342 /DNA_ID=CAMNT_0027563681 /DNA_START=45 /DNA_END=1073 /DNA_ORIENTATION=+
MTRNIGGVARMNIAKGFTTATRQFGDSAYTFAFMANNTFLKADQAAGKKSPFSIAGIPFDGATTNRPGARFGPRSIRDASHMLCDATHPDFNVSPLKYINDQGDLNLPNTSLADMRKKLEPLAAELLKKHHMIWLGGDHSVTLSLLRAQRAHVGRPLAVIHFDAHCDTWEDHFSEPSGHGTWVYEAVQEGLVIPECFTQIGIRSPGEKRTLEYVADQGGAIHTARQLRGRENPEQLKEVLDSILNRHKQHGNPPTYLTLDIDCLDPAYAPGTGTPEIGGMSTRQVMTILEELGPRLNFVGMDCVEVSPPFDHSELTSQAAAGFVWTYLCARIFAGMNTYTPP